MGETLQNGSFQGHREDLAHDNIVNRVDTNLSDIYDNILIKVNIAITTI